MCYYTNLDKLKPRKIISSACIIRQELNIEVLQQVTFPSCYWIINLSPKAISIFLSIRSLIPPPKKNKPRPLYAEQNEPEITAERSMQTRKAN